MSFPLLFPSKSRLVVGIQTIVKKTNHRVKWNMFQTRALEGHSLTFGFVHLALSFSNYSFHLLLTTKTVATCFVSLSYGISNRLFKILISIFSKVLNSQQHLSWSTWCFSRNPIFRSGLLHFQKYSCHWWAFCFHPNI